MQEVFDEIRSALHTVWNRRWVALGVAWVICVLGWLAIAFIPNSYEMSCPNSSTYPAMASRPSLRFARPW